MSIKLENLISANALAVVRTGGLHKIAGAMHAITEVTLKEAASIIGARAYYQRRESEKIAAGLRAYNAVTKG